MNKRSLVYEEHIKVFEPAEGTEWWKLSHWLRKMLN